MEHAPHTPRFSLPPATVEFHHQTPSRSVGLLAGWGRYPIVVAQALRAQGYRIVGLGIKDHTSQELIPLCDEFKWIGLAKLGQAIRFFRRHGVERATMAGKVHKVEFYRPWVWIKHLPDWRAIRCFYPHFVLHREDRLDDTLLRAVINDFAKDHISFEPATNFVPEVLVKLGHLTHVRPTAAQMKDIAFGWERAREMGRLDIGQSVIIKDRCTIAVEAIEGTDEAIKRAGALCARGGFTVVKVAKPQQDMRFDVPTIGLGTVQTMAAAGGSVLAVEAGKTILLDQEEMVRYAECKRIAIVALDAAGGLASEDPPQALAG